MDPYSPTLAPAGFGLNNTGAICYLNSFLQTLASCTSLTRAVLANADYLNQTKTGAAFLAYVRAYATTEGAYEAASPGIGQLSAAVLAALMADLAVRRPHVRTHFGASQESASEALVQLLDMMEPPHGDFEEEVANIDRKFDKDVDPNGPPQQAVHSAESPITRLFLHRFRCDLHCRECKKVVSKETDYAVNFNLFHLDRLRDPPKTVESFSKNIRLQVSANDGYICPNCKKMTAAYRVYNLTMVPEIIFCTFNLYVGYGGSRVTRYFPASLEFPATDGGKLVFRLVGQVEHSGSLGGGHYWARGLRAGDRVFLLNDSSVSPSAFAPTPYTYIIAYHYLRHDPPANNALAQVTQAMSGLSVTSTGGL
jgi:ubiquitin C-terminal hydrolase